MFEARERPAGASLARAQEVQLFITYLCQQMRNAPAVLDALDADELRQLLKAVDDLHQQAHVHLDIAIAQRAAATDTTALQDARAASLDGPA